MIIFLLKLIDLETAIEIPKGKKIKKILRNFLLCFIDGYYDKKCDVYVELYYIFY